MRRGLEQYVLYKSIATAAPGIVFLKLDELEFAERLEDVLQVLFSDAEVDISDVEAVEGNRVAVARAIGAADLAVLLSFRELDDNRNT